jgi:hypothetical protein
MSKRRNDRPASWELAERVRELLKDADGTRFTDLEYAVLEQLAWHWNQERGVSFPGVARIARRVDRSDKQVRRVLDDLHAVKAPGVGPLVECVAGARGGQHQGKGITQVFTLAIAAWPDVKPDADTAGAKVGGHPDVQVVEVPGHLRPSTWTSEAKVPGHLRPKYLDISAKVPGHPDVHPTEREQRLNRERTEGAVTPPAHSRVKQESREQNAEAAPLQPADILRAWQEGSGGDSPRRPVGKRTA